MRILDLFCKAGGAAQVNESTLAITIIAIAGFTLALFESMENARLRARLKRDRWTLQLVARSYSFNYSGPIPPCDHTTHYVRGHKSGDICECGASMLSEI